MADTSDWRLQGQERYLKGVALALRKYQRFAPNPSWDHDHCEFCGAKFMVEDLPDVLHERETGDTELSLSNLVDARKLCH